jgi:hypothetical protein
MQEQTVAAGTPAAAGPAGPAAASVRLLFLLDITGSMSQEIEACKGAMQGLVSMSTSQLQDHAGQISFAVITFTEDNKAGCFTSLFESTSAEEAQAYVDGIQLSRPPEAPQYSAGGDDGPENHKVRRSCSTLIRFICHDGRAGALCAECNMACYRWGSNPGFQQGLPGLHDAAGTGPHCTTTANTGPDCTTTNIPQPLNLLQLHNAFTPAQPQVLVPSA